MNKSIALVISIEKRKLTKATQTLLGICSGLIADGSLNDKEIFYLKNWLLENQVVCKFWPGNVIANRVDSILSDGLVTEDERNDLIFCLKNLSGNHFHETGTACSDEPAIPFDDDPSIFFNNMTFCFTGNFYFGTRAACERAVLKLGGMPVDTVSGKLDYLVVGSIVEPSWINATYGRKIETAIQRQQRYGQPAIVKEAQWVKALEES